MEGRVFEERRIENAEFKLAARYMEEVMKWTKYVIINIEFT